MPANSDAHPGSAGLFNPLTIQPEGIALQPVELGSPASHSGWSQTRDGGGIMPPPC